MGNYGNERLPQISSAGAQMAHTGSIRSTSKEETWAFVMGILGWELNEFIAKNQDII